MGVIQAIELMLTIIAALSGLIAAAWARAAVHKGERAVRQVDGALEVLALIQGDLAHRQAFAAPTSASPADVAPASPDEIPDGFTHDDVRKPSRALTLLSGHDAWTARGLVDGVWHDLSTLAALANAAEGSTEDLDLAEHLGPTMDGLAGRLEIALKDLYAYPSPPSPPPAPKSPPAAPKTAPSESTEPLGHRDT
jgi:hypothetical protein